MPCLCSMYSAVLTVPDKAPFSSGTDTAYPPHTSVFHPRLPACSPNTPHAIEEMGLCWTEVSLLVKPPLLVRSGKADADGCKCRCYRKSFHNMTKRILLNSLFLTAIVICKNEDSGSFACHGVVCGEHRIFPENLRFQCSELWRVQGEQQEGHGDPTEGTPLWVFNMQGSIHPQTRQLSFYYFCSPDPFSV